MRLMDEIPFPIDYQQSQQQDINHQSNKVENAKLIGHRLLFILP
jgi:hypothetical protein